MQDIKQKISPIKQRILQFIDTLSISKREFYAKTGISRGTLESNTGITEDIMAKVLAHYGEISIHWLISGEGHMYHSKNQDKLITKNSKQPMSEDTQNAFIKLILEKDKEIRELAEELGAIKQELREYKKKSGYQNSSFAAES